MAPIVCRNKKASTTSTAAAAAAFNSLGLTSVFDDKRFNVWVNAASVDSVEPLCARSQNGMPLKAYTEMYRVWIDALRTIR